MGGMVTRRQGDRLIGGMVTGMQGMGGWNGDLEAGD